MINILEKKKSFILGINSGTSVDGLDMAVVEIDRTRKKYTIRYITGYEKKFPQSMKNKILEIADNPKSSVDEMIYLDNALGMFIGKSVQSYMKRLLKNSIQIDAIASHGQTIRHLPKKIKYLGSNINGTLQIGSADFISSYTKLPVVSDFRQADIANGGEGAPITTAAMFKMFANKEQKLILNIGGMSNYFYIPSQSSQQLINAEDCGPGNVLIDSLMKKLFHKEYDKNGKIARSGFISKGLLTLLSANSFKSVKEKSTGREQFGEKTVKSILQNAKKLKLSNSEIIATTVEFTAYSIFQSLSPLVKKKKIAKLCLTGGGRKNIFLVERLQSYFPNCQIEIIDRFGVDGDFVEASAYAVMGEATLRNESLQLLKNKPQVVYGKITLPPLVG